MEQAQSGRFPFSGYGASRHLTADAVISEAGVASKFGLFRIEVCCCRATVGGAVIFEATTATKFGKQPVQVWAGPLCGPQIAQQSEKAKRHQSGACSDLTAPGFFFAQTALCSNKIQTGGNKKHRQPNQHRRLVFFAQLFSPRKKRVSSPSNYGLFLSAFQKKFGRVMESS